MLFWKLCLLSVWFIIVGAEKYAESLNLKPLPRNSLLATFQFDVESLPTKLDYYNETIEIGDKSISDGTHYNYFPRSLGPIIESTNTRELHLRFTQGWWDSELWGRLPLNGLKSGGTGVEVSAVIEAPNLESAKKNWNKLSNSLSGFFCASLNFIDDTITTTPKHHSNNNGHFILNPNNKLYFLRAALPSEPICTENLTPFLKLLPTRGKAGISSLLEGHRVFDSLWHGMSIDVITECDEADSTCHLSMSQSVNSVIDIMRSIRKKKEGIPRPTPGEELRCDDSKVFNIWQCFPLGDPTNITWDLETVFGRTINGPALIGDSKTTSINIEIDSNFWETDVIKSSGASSDVSTLSMSPGSKSIEYFVDEPCKYNFNFTSSDSQKTAPIETPPLHVYRSLTGYSQDQGGFRVVLSNPSPTESIDFIYFETLPWYMRLYLHTLTMTVKDESGFNEVDTEQSNYIKSRYYKPAIDRTRPSHLEFSVSLPASTTMTLTYQFDKSLLLYAEYPPDANHGFAIDPAVINVLDEAKNSVYEMRTTSLLLYLPTPDFSMPYNVIILTCTVMSLAFGSIFNLLTKKVITEQEFEKIAANGKISIIINRIRDKIKTINTRR
ncbi:unnamed protein product [Debaryomyces tyrocola]|nr:unnamed protein product [Debaryomyces tyrocola]